MKIRPKLLFKWRTLLMVSILGILGLLLSGVFNAQAPDVIARDAWSASRSRPRQRRRSTWCWKITVHNVGPLCPFPPIQRPRLKCTR